MSEFWDWLIHFSDRIETGIESLTESLWLYPSIYGVSLVDAVIPVVPSESVVIAAAAAGDPVNLLLLFVVAAAGAWCGDQIAYFIGTKVDVRTIKVFRRPRVLKALDWAEHSLQRRGALYIIAARFIPMGRVAVNLTAGALRYPRRRFMAVDAVATSIWAGWGILIGTVAEGVFGDRLLLSVAAGIAGGVLLGFAVDKVMRLMGLAEPDLPDLAHEIELQQHIESDTDSPEVDSASDTRRD